MGMPLFWDSIPRPSPTGPSLLCPFLDPHPASPVATVGSQGA